jgi:hypothetical protein
VASVVQDWPRYVADIYRVTALGGRIQLTELSFRFESQNGNLPKDSGLKVMERALRMYAAFNRYNPEIESNLVALVRNAGFHGVEEKEFVVPVGNWSTGIPIFGPDRLIGSDPNLSRVGALMFEHYTEAVGDQGRACMIEIGIPEDVADMYIEKLRMELRDSRLKLSVKGYVNGAMIVTDGIDGV